MTAPRRSFPSVAGPPGAVPASGDQLFSRSRVFMDKEQELALVRDCQKGDRQALGQLVRGFERPVYNAAFRILGNPEDAADVTQTTFLKLFGHLDEFDARFRLFSWIYRITVNEAIDQLNRRKRFEPIEEAPPSDGDDSESSLAQHQLSHEIQAVLMELSEEYRTVMVLRYFTECSYRQIGEILQIPEKTVKSRLFTARQRMKCRLEDHGILSS